MPPSPSRLSYLNEYEILDRALTSDRGLRVSFTDGGAARSFQLRLNKARRLNREDNAETYDATHPLHGRSDYDTLLIKLRVNGEGSAVLIEKVDRGMVIEEIEE